jgi:hypothetical protein
VTYGDTKVRNALLVFNCKTSVAVDLGRPSQTVVYFEVLEGVPLMFSAYASHGANFSPWLEAKGRTIGGSLRVVTVTGRRSEPGVWTATLRR